MIDLHTFIGEPIPFLKHTKIYPPKVKDVICNPNILSLGKMLALDENDVSEMVKGTEKLPTPFEFLLINAYHNHQFLTTIEQAFMCYIHKKVTFLFDSKMILLCSVNIDSISTSDIVNEDVITEENYQQFGDLIMAAAGFKREKREPLSSNPAVARIQKLARKRDAIKNKQNKNSGVSFETCLVAICCMGIGITPLNIGEMSYASIQAILKMMQDKEKYELDIKSLLAGADSKKVKPVYWIKND